MLSNGVRNSRGADSSSEANGLIGDLISYSTGIVEELLFLIRRFLSCEKSSEPLFVRHFPSGRRSFLVFDFLIGRLALDR